MKLVLFISLLGLVSCGKVSHEASGNMTTNVEAHAKIDIMVSTCDDERFTVEQKLKCIELITQPKGTVEAEVNSSILENILEEVLEEGNN